MNGYDEDWHGANQRYLAASVDLIKAGIGQAIQEEPDERLIDELKSSLENARQKLPRPAAIDIISDSFALSNFERSILLLCAGFELEASISTLCAAIQRDPSKVYPTFGIALAALPDAHWSALLPGSPLRRWQLIYLGNGLSLTTSPLKIDEMILHYLTGLYYPDPRLSSIMEAVDAQGPVPPSQSSLAERISMAWSHPDQGMMRAAVQICGGDAGDRMDVAALACASLGMGMYRLDISLIPSEPEEIDEILRLWEREAVLSKSVLFIDWSESTDESQAPSGAIQFIGRSAFPLIISSQTNRLIKARPTVYFDLMNPTHDEQRDLWKDLLPTTGFEVARMAEGMASEFDMSTRSIRAAGLDILARSKGQASSAQLSAFALREACIAVSRPKLDGLAQRIEPMATWDDIVLPDDKKRMLQRISVHVRQRSKVYGSWGFRSKGHRGLGISALFAGASGTGKTMAAEVLAGELGMDLYRIDLSRVVSKYIGETEKNLARVFDAAEAGGSILLFDEADALFGKRSEVRDSHDRYANIEVSYLLQRMESYRGLAILTTNMKSALDASFLRRLRFIVSFSFPDENLRRDIWRRIFPQETPLDGLDFTKLSRLNVAGGNIRSIALNAAFLAADENSPVRMDHILQAAKDEYSKLEKPLTDAEIAGWC